MNGFDFFQSVPWNSAVWFRETDKVRGSGTQSGNTELSLQLPIPQSQRNSAIEENCADNFFCLRCLHQSLLAQWFRDSCLDSV